MIGAVVAGLLAGCVSAQTAYIGTYTGDSGSKGVYRIRVDKTKGIVGKPELVAEVDNPSFLALSDDKSRLYAVSESANKLFAYDAATYGGALKLLNEEETGRGPCHLAISIRLIAVADYGGGSMGVWRLERDGSIGKKEASFQYTYASKATDRQQRPHAHGVTFSPPGANTPFLVPDLGADRVYVYRNQSGIPSRAPRPLIVPHETAPWIELPPGRGPRHVAFFKSYFPNAEYLYVLNELSNTVSVFGHDAKEGLFTFIEEVSTLPADFKGQSTSAELIVLNNTVYTTNRGHDSIARFQRDPQTGRLTLAECVPCGGKSPRHFSLVPGTPWMMLVANQNSNNIAVFRVAKDGALTLMPDAGVEIGAPVCVLFE
jgi:6-phosphogluconolactonase